MNPSAAHTPRHWLASALARSVPDPSALDGVAAALPLGEAWRETCALLDWSPDQVARALADRFRLKRADLSAADPQAAALLPDKVARDRGLVALRHTDRTLVVATANPLDAEAEQEVAFLSGRTAEFEVATPDEIGEALEDRGEGAGSALFDVLDDLSEAVELDSVRILAEEQAEEVSEREARATPVIRLTNLILQKAVQAGATDIHMEPERDEGRVRFRVDGVLQPFITLPLPALVRVVSRIKILSELDIADRIRPQDGRMRAEIGGRALDLRVSTVPVRSYEKVVIRILDSSATFDMEGLGLGGETEERLAELLSHRNGIVLVTGPTGSGKTTTLYAALTSLRSEELNISTVEHPVEYELRGISQIQVEPRKGVTFASALRALLRQDPDVILVGEIRDHETAEVAAHASLTGHQVLSTLHTNDAVGAVSRLQELGLHASVVASSLRGVVAQRLVRRLCPACARDVRSRWELPREERARWEATGVRPIRWAPGCDQCNGSGFRGRVPIVEILELDRDLSRAIADEAGESALRDLLVDQGHRDLWDAGVRLVEAGVTSLTELERVVGAHEDEEPAPARAGKDAPDGRDHGEAQPSEAPDRDDGPDARPGDPEVPAPDPPEAGAATRRILVVEDDTGTRTLIRAALVGAGYEVLESGDGEDALNRLGRDDAGIDLVTLDLNMPRLGGMEVLEAMRSNPTTAHIPVVVATHSDDEASELALLSAGADDYMVKPVNPARLVSRIAAVLRRQAYRDVAVA